jgi:3,4-dihydroxy 2-butanone 4-phosphate synthase/GTP cyclohydrolase II
VPLARIEDAIADIREGRFVIIVDDEDRENEGDLAIAADRVTSEHINFMATHARGLVCVACEPWRLDELGLSPMVATTPRSSAPPSPSASTRWDAV